MFDPRGAQPDGTECLAAVPRAELLDTPPDEAFDRLTTLASQLLHAPVALVSLVDGDREVFKSAIGLPGEWVERRETARAQSLAHPAMLANPVIRIEDARHHPLVKDNSLIRAWGVESYVAVPFVSKDGRALGNIYVMDRVPRAWGDGDVASLTAIALAAETQVALCIALRDAERAHAAVKTMLEGVPYAIFAVDRDWRFTFANAMAEELLRFACADHVGNSLWTACPLLVGTELEHQLRGALLSTTGTSFEGHLVPFDAWYEAFAEPSEQGLTVFFKDVTARKRVDDALSESERRYRFVFEEGLTCNVVTAPDGRLFACNQSFVSTFGFTSMEEARTAKSATLWRDVSKREAMLQALRARGRFGPVDVEIQRVDGVPIDATLTAVARFEAGVMTEIHASLLDITERKKLEAQFRQSQKMEAVGQVAGGMAHDFNNLLTVIKAYVQLTLAELDDVVPLRADIKVIGDATDRAAELTRQLLAFSRQQVLLPQRINLRAVVTGIEPLIRTLMGPEVEVVADVSRPVPDIEADRSQLEQVIMNLAVNARDAMPNGGRIAFAIEEMEVTRASEALHHGTPQGTYAALSVRDSGAGMSPETVAQIFEPFFTTKGPGKGTGLGLSTVYGIVHQSGGHVGVTSAVDEGTTFTIYLPAITSPPAPAPGAAAPAESEPYAANGRTVLVVDDDAPVRHALTRSLSRIGYTVLEAADGESAVVMANAQEEPIDLLLTDVEMPGMQGTEVAERLRTTVPRLPVIFMSGYSDVNGPFQPPASSPPYLFVAKPFSTEEITAAVRAALGRSPQ